jgi:hypothetical protein
MGRPIAQGVDGRFDGDNDFRFVEMANRELGELVSKTRRNKDWSRVSRKVAPSTFPCWVRWRKTMLGFGRWSLRKNRFYRVSRNS